MDLRKFLNAALAASATAAIAHGNKQTSAQASSQTSTQTSTRKKDPTYDEAQIQERLKDLGIKIEIKKPGQSALDTVGRAVDPQVTAGYRGR